jgi:hypothetical protein
MLSINARAFFVSILVGTLCLATNPAIGLVVTNGSFSVDAAQVRGNATLFEGNMVETAKTPSQVQLNNGVKMRLSSASRATIFGGRTVLERGTGQLESSGAYEMEARTLRISGTEPNTVARVQLSGKNSVIVAAVTGTVQVTNANGLLVALMVSGRELEFEPQDAGAAAATKITGCLMKKDGKFVVVDQATNVSMEVQGPGIEKSAGQRVEVTGTASGSVLTAVTVTALGKGCPAGAGGKGTAKTAATSGLSKAATVAIVGGVAVGATAGGLAAAGVFSGGASAPSPASR